jgi:uncharacterized membrane protein
MLLVNTAILEGALLYEEATLVLDIPEERAGVPRLVVGDEYMVGSGEIPARFPGLIEEGLAGEGIDWPDLPGMGDALAAVPGHDPVTTEPAVTSTTLADPGDDADEVIPITDGSIADRLGRDPVGSALAILILAVMISSLPVVAMLIRRGVLRGSLSWAVPLLSLLGLAVAAYLTYVETSGTTAVCGPVGDCNAVQQSEYAKLFGVVPVGLIGVVGYVVAIVAWVIARLERGRVSEWARVALLAGTAVGTVFSIYLTFLEPFVIGANCAWCLTSAVIITALLWLSAGSGVGAWRRLRESAAGGA